MTLNNANPALIEALNHILADSFVLYFKTHSYHWNVTGPQFKSLHDMFEEQYTEMWKAIDELAERLRILGATAPHSMANILSNSDLAEATDMQEAMAMVKDLANSNTTLCGHIQKAIDIADDVDDEATEDMLIGRLQVHQQYAWMLKSTCS